LKNFDWPAQGESIDDLQIRENCIVNSENSHLVKRCLDSDFAQTLSVVRLSGFFDSQWYLARYPDVRAGELDPLEHYVRHGAAELRSPGPRFEARLYVRKNPEVSKYGVNPVLHFMLKEEKDLRQISAREFLVGGEVVAGEASVASLLDALGETTPRKPAKATAENWMDVPSQWESYFLANGAFAQKQGRIDEALDFFTRAIQSVPHSDSGYRLYDHVFERVNHQALADFQQTYSAAKLIVAHVSCRERLSLAQASVRSFEDASPTIDNLTVVGDASLPRDSYVFQAREKLLIVPAADTYECLPQKVQKLFMFLGRANLDAHVLKIDDDIRCADPVQLHRDLQNVMSQSEYGGAIVVQPEPFLASTCWHLNKCADGMVNEQPDSLVFLAPFVSGKYYWLHRATVRALSKMALIHSRLFQVELYEDRAIGAVLAQYGFACTAYDLVRSGSISRVRG
jgi:hypothetical protein